MNHIQLRRSVGVTALVAFVLVLVPGCKRAVVRAPSLATVTVSQPLQRDVIRWDQYSGYLSSPQTVTVNARVSRLSPGPLTIANPAHTRLF